MRFLLSITLFFLVCGLFAAPLEGGYSLAPRSSASNEEKTTAYIHARQTVIETSKKYLGTPYQYGGMSHNGMDCSGFLCQSFKDALGVSLPRSAAGLYTWTERIPLDKAQPGDFLFFRTGPNNNITHVGLYLGGRRFIHAASSGPKTGVIYSSLNEQYWEKSYAGAGRAFPEAPSGFKIDDSSNNNAPAVGGDTYSETPRKKRTREKKSEKAAGRLLIGAAVAPIWNGFIKGGELVRGVSSHFYIYADTYSLGPRMVFGLEVRPEYDGAFGVFSLPVTLSWGPSDKFRIFAGPVFNFGEAVLETEEGKRHYSGRTDILATVGVTAAPFAIPTPAGDFNPYIELAWQSYFSDNKKTDLAADFSAGFRFSTGIRWQIQIK